MLSRDAEHLYWLSRYVERVENTARLINVNSELMLDFPGDKTLGWKSIVETLDNLDIYQRRYIAKTIRALKSGTNKRLRIIPVIVPPKG